MLKIYAHMWQLNWAEQWQYRANLLMYLLYWLVSPIIFLSVWRAVAASQGAVNGFTAGDFTAYYMTLLLVDNLTSQITIHILEYKIRDGTLAGDLLRPVHPILTGTLENNLAFKTLNFAALLPGWAVWATLYLLFRPDFSGVTLGNLLLAVPIIALGFAISFLLGAALTFVAFWTTRAYALSEFYHALTLAAGRAVCPARSAAGGATPGGRVAAVPVISLLSDPTHPRPAQPRADRVECWSANRLARHRLCALSSDLAGGSTAFFRGGGLT
jgi:ABC-2 type transport system permease protein